MASFDSDAGALSGYEVDEHDEHDDSLHFGTGGGLRGSKSTPALSERDRSWARQQKIDPDLTYPPSLLNAVL